MKRTLTIVALSCFLQSCGLVVGAAAGAAAIAVVYDHRTIQYTLQDASIAKKIVDKYRSIPQLSEESHIDVTVFNHIVLLTGEAPNPEWRQRAEDIAKAVSGVDHVYNQISVQGPTSTLTRTSDSWITTKIRSLMLARQDLKSSNIKVVTENGTVYLMGTVSRQQADIAVDISRQVTGVQKVIKIFQYTN